MTLTQNPVVLPSASLKAMTDDGDPNAEEGFAMDIDLEIDVSNDDTVVIHRASGQRPRLAVPPRNSDGRAVAVTDQLIAIRQIFDESSYGDLQRIKVTRRGDTICLSGRLPSFFLKQTAQEIVRQQDANQQINNEIQVG